MKIIEPSAKIIEAELPQNIYQRIDACASVCYQRPAKPTVEEAEQFCRSMVERGHLTTLEMVVVHLVCPAYCVPMSDYVKFTMLTSDKYTSDEYTGPPMYVVTGSIRALIEATNSFDVTAFLAGELPTFFPIPEGLSNDFDSMEGVRFAEPHEIPWQHKYVAARFIINRAVSHELVRHRPCSFLQESQRYCRYEDEVTFIRPEWTYGDMETSTETKFWEIHMYASEDKYRHLLKRGLKPQQARAVLPNSTKTEVICYASLPQWLHIFNLRCSPAADSEMRRVMIPLREEFKEKYPEAFE